MTRHLFNTIYWVFCSNDEGGFNSQDLKSIKKIWCENSYQVTYKKVILCILVTSYLPDLMIWHPLWYKSCHGGWFIIPGRGFICLVFPLLGFFAELFSVLEQ